VVASPEASNDELKALAFDDEKVKEQTAGKEIVKVIVIPQRLVNIVIR
jgi:leucyl-tRNA synthetase